MPRSPLLLPKYTRKSMENMGQAHYSNNFIEKIYEKWKQIIAPKRVFYTSMPKDH